MLYTLSYSLASIRPLAEKLRPRHFRHGRKQDAFNLKANISKAPPFMDRLILDPHIMAASVPKTRPGSSSRDSPAASGVTFLLRLPVHIHTAASPPDGLFHLPLMLMFRPCFPSSYPSFHPASLQGRGCCMSGYSLAPHSLHSQSMSVPSPGALALLVEAVVFPPIPSHSRLFCC